MKLALQFCCFILALGATIAVPASLASAQQQLEGQVLGAGAPIASATVTLFAAGSGAPAQLARTETGTDGHFALRFDHPQGGGTSLYLLATGGEPTASKGSGSNPGIALLAVVGTTSPAKVTVNEMTTIASVWTHAQFLDGTAIRGHALGLRIAAGNVPNFVDLQTGGWGSAIQDPLNSNQTTTMANFATIADALSGCIARVTSDACDRLFAATKPPVGTTPTDTLTAAEAIAKYPWYQPGRVFSLLTSPPPQPPASSRQ